MRPRDVKASFAQVVGRMWHAVGSYALTAEVQGDSMQPTLRRGDWVLVVRRRGPSVGRVVLVRDPRDVERLMVKRVARMVGRQVWVEGDNPSASTDSRTFGPVDPGLLEGQVVLRYYPPRWPVHLQRRIPD